MRDASAKRLTLALRIRRLILTFLPPHESLLKGALMPCCTKSIVGAALLGCVLLVGVSGADILNPKMTPEKGTFDAPAGKMGEKAKGAWSQTTMAAGVDGKPLAGKVTTIVGEIVDYSCYLQLGKHGTKHRDCGQKCLKNGQPIGLVTKEGKLYLLMEEEHD